jgi:hypothetical protein
MMNTASSPRTSGRDAPCHAPGGGAHASITSSLPAPGMIFVTTIMRADGACETSSKTRLNKLFFGLILLDRTIG